MGQAEKMKHSQERILGNLAAVIAYMLWGFMPIYWNLIDGATPLEVLAHRVIWSFVFMCIVILITKNGKKLAGEMKALLADKKRLFIMLGASATISLNWYLYIWAVANEHIVQTSLGYYINPLLSVLLGVWILKEKLSAMQVVSVGLAFIGVLLLTLQSGAFPWVAFLLAITFGLYGLLKKLVRLGAMVGLTIETLLTMPFALGYVFTLQANGTSAFGLENPPQMLLLIGAGVATAVPLLLFATGANRISLAMLGFFQYIAPTIMLILGTVVYHEPFNDDQLFAFILIWISLLLFTLAQAKWFHRLEHRMLRKQTRSS